MAAQPWDQLPDESDAHYTQFLVYRDLKWTRSLLKAYRKYINCFDLSTEVPKSPSGAFKETATRHHWVERAEAWDVWFLTVRGNRAAPLFVRALENIAIKLEKATRTTKLGDKKWRDVLDTVKALGERLEPAIKAGSVAPTPMTVAKADQGRAAVEEQDPVGLAAKLAEASGPARSLEELAREAVE